MHRCAWRPFVAACMCVLMVTPHTRGPGKKKEKSQITPTPKEMGLSARRSGGGGAAQGHPSQSSGAGSTTATPLRGSRSRFTQALAGGRSGRRAREWGQARTQDHQQQGIPASSGSQFHPQRTADKTPSATFEAMSSSFCSQTTQTLGCLLP